MEKKFVQDRKFAAIRQIKNKFEKSKRVHKKTVPKNKIQQFRESSYSRPLTFPGPQRIKNSRSKS